MTFAKLTFLTLVTMAAAGITGIAFGLLLVAPGFLFKAMAFGVLLLSVQTVVVSIRLTTNPTKKP